MIELIESEHKKDQSNILIDSEKLCKVVQCVDLLLVITNVYK